MDFLFPSLPNSQVFFPAFHNYQPLVRGAFSDFRSGSGVGGPPCQMVPSLGDVADLTQICSEESTEGVHPLCKRRTSDEAGAACTGASHFGHRGGDEEAGGLS